MEELVPKPPNVGVTPSIAGVEPNPPICWVDGPHEGVVVEAPKPTPVLGVPNAPAVPVVLPKPRVLLLGAAPPKVNPLGFCDVPKAAPPVGWPNPPSFPPPNPPLVPVPKGPVAPVPKPPDV